MTGTDTRTLLPTNMQNLTGTGTETGRVTGDKILKKKDPDTLQVRVTGTGGGTGRGLGTGRGKKDKMLKKKERGTEKGTKVTQERRRGTGSERGKIRGMVVSKRDKTTKSKDILLSPFCDGKVVSRKITWSN